ncbi:MAG TPA: hypothetical protein VNP96_03570 [Solirubrobacterales bacterium]|nr:hypothetical protein [Solirubrobacterales bacterium]
MTVSPVSEGEIGERTGSRTLQILASSVSSQILRALSGGPLGLTELGDDLGSAIQIPGRDAGSLEAKITPSGREMLFVSTVLEDWLEKAPGGVLPFGGDGATEAVEALAGSWSSTMLHTLAAGPRSRTELSRFGDVAGYSSTERCLEAMQLAGQVEARNADGEGAAYSVTDWLREGLAPIVAAARMERRHLVDAPPVAPLDAEAAFMLSLPLLRLPADLSGSCCLTVEMTGGGVPRRGGAMVRVEEGRIVSCTPRLEGDPDAWATGDLNAWFSTVIDSDAGPMEVGGDEDIAGVLLAGLHEVLFGV